VAVLRGFFQTRLSLVSALLGLLTIAPGHAVAIDTAASIAAELRQLSIDPAQTYRVRELQIARGDIKVYLTEGILAFAKPVAGRTVAAVFTTEGVEAGDAEVLVLPPVRSERAALASFIKTPNLDEHILSGVLLFSDDTAKELQSQIQDRPLHPEPEMAKQMAATADGVLRSSCVQIDVRLTKALLDNHPSQRGFFYGIVAGRTLGVFDVAYEPDRFEPVIVGRLVRDEQGAQNFQVWCSFRPRRMAGAPASSGTISGYRLDTDLHPDLTMASQAQFQYKAVGFDGRVISLELSTRLRVTAAKVDGKPAEVFQHDRAGKGPTEPAATFLLIATEPLAPEASHVVEVSYEGSVVRRTPSGNYFVDERNTWYPFVSPMLSTFDLTFHCPENLRVVSTGELVADDVVGGVRTVHRKTPIAESLAGFNLGNYEESSADHGRYRIELFANKLENSAGLPAQAASILDYFTARWEPLPIHSLAISPIEGYFGQGFPGLIYLSSVAYIREEDRPARLRNPQLDSFFSEMLFPHEVAHQWWGNMVSQADYRTAWLVEAMSNYSALEYLEQNKGRSAMEAILNRYRQDLLLVDKGATIEAAGPVDFGERLLDNNGLRAWHDIVYEKGAWILHMLRMRLGDEAFHTLQMRMLSDFRDKLIANDDFRKLAAELLPPEVPDRSLNSFFDNWVYATGIPKIALHGARASLSVKISGVDEGFAADLPLHCLDAAGKERVQWIHAGAGDNSYDLPNGSRSCELPKQADYLYELEN
jgi:hypothetical protein